MTAGAYLNSLQAYYVPTGALRILFLKPDYVPAGALRIYSPEYDTKGSKLITGNFAIWSHILAGTSLLSEKFKNADQEC